MTNAKDNFKKRIEIEQQNNKINFQRKLLNGTYMKIPCRDCDVEVYYYDINTVDKASILFLMHGGGFALGHAGYEDSLCCRLMRSLNSKVVSINYRKTPRYPYPAAIHDVYDVVKYFNVNADKFNIDRNKIFVMGNSAGANLATVVSMLAKKKQEFKIKCQILGYPYLDCATPPKRKKYYAIDFPADYMEVFNEYYAQDNKRRDVYVSPIYASKDELNNLPPTIFILADLDALSDEGKAYANSLLEAGVEVHVKKVIGAQHGFIEHHFENILTEQEKSKYSKTFDEDAEKAIDFIVQTVKSYL